MIKCPLVKGKLPPSMITDDTILAAYSAVKESPSNARIILFLISDLRSIVFTVFNISLSGILACPNLPHSWNTSSNCAFNNCASINRLPSCNFMRARPILMVYSHPPSKNMSSICILRQVEKSCVNNDENHEVAKFSDSDSPYIFEYKEAILIFINALGNVFSIAKSKHLHSSEIVLELSNIILSFLLSSKNVSTLKHS
jgi:hypothetical protein